MRGCSGEQLGGSNADAATSPGTEHVMSQPIESVARIARTPSEAKIFVAMLQAQGIPARVDGDSLADEFAASQRLMNLSGTKVMVPTSSLERAREILQPEPIDPDELERAALAGSPESPPLPPAAEPAAAPSPRNSVLLALLFLAMGAAVPLLFLRQGRHGTGPSGQPTELDGYRSEFDYKWDGNACAELRRSDGKLMRLYHDNDQDGIFETIEMYDTTAKKVGVFDWYVDGLYLRSVESRSGGLTVTWTDEDRDGLSDAGVVTDSTGKVLQELRWRAGKGFEVQSK